MTTSLDTGKPDVKIGRDAGWILAFHRENNDGVVADPELEFTRDGYYAEIQASLPSVLDAGVYTFTLEGLTDKDYEKISRNKHPELSVVRFYLFYRDTVMAVAQALFPVDLPDLAGMGRVGFQSPKHSRDLVAELRIQSVTRKAGSRKYETTITARERVFDAVESRRPSGKDIDATDVEQAFKELMKRATPGGVAQAVACKFYSGKKRSKPAPPPPPDAKNKKKGKIDLSTTILDSLAKLAASMEAESGLYGRGMMLIRDGKLHFGPRPIPLDPRDPKPKLLDLAGGLLEVEALRPFPTDPNHDFRKNEQPPSRAQFKLTLRGRQDLKPGDLVEFEIPEQDDSSTKPALGGAFGALTDVVAAFIPGKKGPRAKLYVNSVDHRLGRSAGFLTTITGVEVKSSGDTPEVDDLWDYHSPGRQSRGATTEKAGAEAQLAEAAREAIERTVARFGMMDVGEVRAFFQSTDPGPPQTVELFRGMEPGGTEFNKCVTADILRPSLAPVPSAPYLTPFAWGRCGLILPRYPGMRVLVAHRGADNQDPIDIGALWQRGHAPENGAPGDWWLILPAGDSNGNAPGEDEAGPPEDYPGKVTHDLIDQSGNRFIEVGAFTIRVGKDDLKAAGTRPADAEKKALVTIEHKSKNVRLLLDEDGLIKIEAENIQIEARNNLTMKGKKVTVNCDSMEIP